MRRATAAAVLLAALLLVPLHSQVGAGLREPAWAPDGKRLAVVYVDRVWTMQVDGRDARELMRADTVQREPAWSPDGKRIAFAADRGDGFDIYAVSSRGGSPERITSLPGDARTPSWTPDGRIVFAHRDPGTSQWDLQSLMRTPMQTRACRCVSRNPLTTRSIRACLRTGGASPFPPTGTARTATSISG